MGNKEWYYCIDDKYGWESEEQGQLRKHKGHLISIEYNPGMLTRLLWRIVRMFK